MSRPILADAFEHHVWATLRLIDACRDLTSQQLQNSVAGTFGSIIETIRHLVGADASYLYALTGGGTPVVDDSRMNLPELRTTMEANGKAWASLLDQDLDPESIVVRHRDDGSESHAPLGVRLAQALHHGTDHRSQVCTILTVLGIEPPAIDVWDYADAGGRLREFPGGEFTTPTAP